MSERPEPFRPGSRDIEALVSRAVTEQIDPLRAQLSSLGRALAIVADRVPGRQEVAELSERVEALEGAVRAEADARRAQTDDLRQALAVAVAHAVAKVDQARGADADRILEAVAGLSRPPEPDPQDLRVLVDELRQVLATAVDQIVGRVGAAGATGADQLLDQVAALADRVEAEAQRRDVQAAALLPTIDERLHALHRAGVNAGEEQERRLEARLEAVTSEQGERIVGRIDERTATLATLESVPADVAAEVQAATARALADQVEPLVAKLAEAADGLAHEAGRIKALVERAVRAASAAEEAVAGLRPDDLRAALAGAADTAADEVRAAARRLEEVLAAVAEGSDDGPADHLERLERSVADLRTSQAALRQVVEDGAQKAELASIDVRGLRGRLAPHLVALADATTRRAEADEAGFDAVLARLDQLLAPRQP